ncbi:chloramphenicol-sensitive protein RarD [Nocardia amikacinitolerans]|uniref:Chloramphenicol-sensitive protein RarD n=1 Tax=Nocardia amikacinitolerans TaxID=756689 RepID=A0A285LRA9_9NOCA|nr:EamA family transporter RarD [Nocardia amikacinitolerans]MCP2278912.1 chloramphenicol-sensitive protein RarD [Nocardia amikacinitolerans]MCP2299763.1 chloramphenicol-sensitive protein RarD [Nocardia amikacinitolerans]SNY86983.1 chloramphenicol-sensitive protein RarD [Nocardia amikacinitolerans]
MRRIRSIPGVAFGTSAYLIWGLFPAFFGLLAFASAVEVLAQRILWTLVVVLAVLVVTGRLREMAGIDARTWRLAALASAAISINWGVYVYGVTSGHVVECALGYFVNPLVTVGFGVIIFRERLRRAQWAALGLGAAAVAVLTVDYGRPPWIALALACSFALYGLVKKVIPLDALRGIAAEGIVAAPFALAFVLVLLFTGRSELTSGAGHSALLMSTGPVTLVPLLLFAIAAQRVPLSTMGLLQYLTPALQMAWGVAVAHEPMPASRWAGFALIWAALAIFTTDALLRARRGRRTPAPVAPSDAPTP